MALTLAEFRALVEKMSSLPCLFSPLEQVQVSPATPNLRRSDTALSMGAALVMFFFKHTRTHCTFFI